MGRTSGQPPEAHLVVPAAGDELPTVGSEVDGSNLVGVLTRQTDTHGRHQVPESNSPVLSTAGKEQSVGRVRQAAHRGGVSLQDAHGATLLISAAPRRRRASVRARCRPPAATGRRGTGRAAPATPRTPAPAAARAGAARPPRRDSSSTGSSA